MFIKALEEHLDVEDLISNLKLDPNDIAFLSGSVIEREVNPLGAGIGNKRSDIDVYIIKSDSTFLSEDVKNGYNKQVNTNYFFRLNDLAIEVTVFYYDHIYEIISKIKSFKMSSEIRIRSQLKFSSKWRDYQVNEFLNRFNYSVPIYGKEAYKKLKEDFSLTNYCYIYEKILISNLDNFIPDVLGNLEENQIDTALFCAREAFLNFCKAVLYHEKQLVDRDKWVVLKLKNLASMKADYMVVINQYNRLFVNFPQEVDYQKKTIKESLRFINEFLLEMEEF